MEFSTRNRYVVWVRTKAIFASAVLIAVLLFIAILFALLRQPAQTITVRHVKSVQSDNVTAMTFEIKNHTATPYIFFPFEVRIRNGSIWSKFQGFTAGTIQPIPTIDPTGLATYTINVTNLPIARGGRADTLLEVQRNYRRQHLYRNLCNQSKVPSHLGCPSVMERERWSFTNPLLGQSRSTVWRISRLSIDGAEFWLSDESPAHGNFSPESLGGGSVKILLSVPDPDGMFTKAVGSGAKEVYPVSEEHGWRVGRVADPFGHHWEIGKPLSEGR